MALLNAGASPAGQEFSARNVDINLIALPIEETPGYVKNIKALAADKYERDIDVWTSCLVVCRETEKEAKAAHQAIIDAGDWPGAQIIMDVLGIERLRSGPRAASGRMRSRIHGPPTSVATRSASSGGCELEDQHFS